MRLTRLAPSLNTWFRNCPLALSFESWLWHRGAGPWPAAPRLVSTLRGAAPTPEGASRRISTRQARVPAPRLVCLALLLSIATLIAQQQDAPLVKFESNTQLVVEAVSVKDKSG